MANFRIRATWLMVACLMKISEWLHHHPLAVELLGLATVIGLIALEDKLINALASQ